MATGSGWKKHLLSSGIPLEHEVARVLASEQFFVGSDYEYLRRDESRGEKEFSVDLSASRMSFHRNPQFSLEMLVECKYRARDKFALFFPDQNLEPVHPTLGHTLAVIDHFVPYHVYDSPIYAFEDTFPFVYKGVEVHEGGATSQDIRHALNQLRYAAPSFIRQMIQEFTQNHIDDRHTKFFIKMIVTNAPIRVLDSGNAIDLIEKAADIPSISKPHDAVILYNLGGPDFRTHYLKVMKGLADEIGYQQIRQLEPRLVREGKKYLGHRDTLQHFLEDVESHGWSSGAFTDQVMVVSLGSLKIILKEIKAVCKEAYRLRKPSGKWKIV
jgi:hypothetical protein